MLICNYMWEQEYYFPRSDIKVVHAQNDFQKSKFEDEVSLYLNTQKTEFVFPCQDVLSQMVYYNWFYIYLCIYKAVKDEAIFHIRINNGKICATIFIETRKNEIKM